MGLVRFMTVFDDEDEIVLNANHRSMLEIVSPAAFFKSQNYSYLDKFNVSTRKFDGMRKAGYQISTPNIPSNVFQYSLEKSRDAGYLAAFIVCPHGKWSPYYKEALHAAKNIQRTAKRHEDDFFKVNVINSKAFGLGTILFANTIALDFYHYRNCTSVIKDFSKRYADSSTTYILTKDNTVFGNSNDYKAYRVTDSRVFELNIGNSVDEVKFDYFADIIVKAVHRASGRYVASFGYSCDFIGNILGRVERDSKHLPIVATQYGVASAALFGTDTLCIHFGEYI